MYGDDKGFVADGFKGLFLDSQEHHARDTVGITARYIGIC